MYGLSEITLYIFMTTSYIVLKIALAAQSIFKNNISTIPLYIKNGNIIITKTTGINYEVYVSKCNISFEKCIANCKSDPSAHCKCFLIY